MAEPQEELFAPLQDMQESIFYAVTFAITAPACLASLCCCYYFCKNWYEYVDDDDDPPPPVKKKLEAKLGKKKKRLNLGAKFKWMFHTAWEMLGDFCQALIFLGMACWFFLIVVLNLMTGVYGTPIWAVYVLMLILILVIVGALAKFCHAYFEAHVAERLETVHDTIHSRVDKIEEALEPIRRMEAPMMRFVDSVENKIHNIEEALAGKIKAAKEQAEKAAKMAQDGLKIVSNFAEEELEAAEDFSKQYCPKCGCRSL